VQQLDGVRVSQLVRGEPPAHPGLDHDAVQLQSHGAGQPSAAASPADDHAEQRADREPRPLCEPGFERRPRPGVHPDLAPAIILAVPDQ
jgi:hypothetical protein